MLAPADGLDVEGGGRGAKSGVEGDPRVLAGGGGGHLRRVGLLQRHRCGPGQVGEAKWTFLVDSGVAWPGYEWGVAM